MGHLSKKRKRMWLIDPHCENCGVLTVLPETLPCKINPNTGLKQYDPLPDNCATIQHKYSRFSDKRGQIHHNEKRLFLWCHKCNWEDHIKEIRSVPIEKLRIMSGNHIGNIKFDNDNDGKNEK